MHQLLEPNQIKRILIVHRHVAFGGTETHVIKLHKTLLEQGHNVFVLIPTNSILEGIFKKENLPFITTKAFKFYPRFRLLYKFLLAKAVYEICKTHKIQIVNCNADFELKPVKLAAKFLPIKIIYTHHHATPVPKKRINGLDGIIAVSPTLEKYFKHENEKHHLKIKNIEFIAPFFNDELFINFKPAETKEDFFKHNFGITITQDPILCMAAGMHDGRKNHALLIKAIHKVVYAKQKPVQVMLAGSGAMLEVYKELVRSLKLEPYVHFLGFTTKTLNLLFHSDINLLPSKSEGLSIALMEAALLKKPTIGSAGVPGIIDIVHHNQTGLLFDLNDVNDLAEKIEFLIDNKRLQQTLGQNAFDFVSANFLTDVKLQKFNAFLDKVISIP